MGMFDFTTIPWMERQDPGATAAISAASHNFNAARDRAQRQDEFQTKLPLWIQEQQNQALESKARLQGMAFSNALKEKELTLFNQDQATYAQWMNDNPTVESRFNATPPKLMTPQWSNTLENTRAIDSTTALGMRMKADQADWAKRVAGLSAEDRSALMSMNVDQKTGLPTPIMWKTLGMMEQRMDAERQRIAQEKVEGPARIRAESAEKIADIKSKTQMDEAGLKYKTQLEVAKNKPKKSFESEAAMAAYKSQLKTIEDADMPLEKKMTSIAQLEKNFRVNNPDNPPPSTATQPAASSKVVVQNGSRFQLNSDGSATYLGPAQ